MQAAHSGSLLLLVIALVPALWACADWRRLVARVRGHATLGRIAELTRKPGEAGDPVALYWHPIVEYRDECGAPRRFVSRCRTATRRLEIGSVVPVRFVPGHPRYAEITSLPGSGADPHSWRSVRAPLVAALGIVLFNLPSWSV